MDKPIMNIVINKLIAWWWTIIAAMVGAGIGMFVIAACVISRDEEESEDFYTDIKKISKDIKTRV